MNKFDCVVIRDETEQVAQVFPAPKPSTINIYKYICAYGNISSPVGFMNYLFPELSGSSGNKEFLNPSGNEIFPL